MDHASVSGGTHSKAVRTAWFAMEKTGLQKAPPSAKWSHQCRFQWETESRCMENQVHKLWKLSWTEILLLKKYVRWRQLMFFLQVYVSIISEFVKSVFIWYIWPLHQGVIKGVASFVLQSLGKVVKAYHMCMWLAITLCHDATVSRCLPWKVFHLQKNGRKNCHQWG